MFFLGKKFQKLCPLRNFEEAMRLSLQYNLRGMLRKELPPLSSNNNHDSDFFISFVVIY